MVKLSSKKFVECVVLGKNADDSKHSEKPLYNLYLDTYYWFQVRVIENNDVAI